MVSLGNLCCCLWLVAGGVLAAWLMQQSHPAPVTPFDGAVVGLLAGVVGAFVYLVIAWPVTLLIGPMMEEWLQRALEGAGDVPLRDVLEHYQGRGARASASSWDSSSSWCSEAFSSTAGVGGHALQEAGPAAAASRSRGPWTSPPPPPVVSGPPPGPERQA